MKLLKNDGNYMDLNVISYQQNILINYEHVLTSSNKIRSIDRGMLSDRYETELVFKGSQEYISGILFELNELRKAGKYLTITDCQEAFWGEHINYTIPLTAVVTDMDRQNNTSWKIQTFKMKLLLNNPSFKSDIGNPFPLQCMSHQWEGSNQWNTITNETYYRNVSFVDKVLDEANFIGKFLMNNLDLTKFYNWYRTVARGGVFTITDSDVGVNNIFGATIQSTTHDVVISSVEYERTSPLLKLVTIELRRTNND